MGILSKLDNWMAGGGVVHYGAAEVYPAHYSVGDRRANSSVLWEVTVYSRLARAAMANGENPLSPERQAELRAEAIIDAAEMFPEINQSPASNL